MKTLLSGRQAPRHCCTKRHEAACNGALVAIDNESLMLDRSVARGEVISAAERLNAFFANSVNSPSMSMVNFSCCVRSTPDVTREAAAQPTHSAVRMEAGVHAGV
jgi:hypothetical protein